MDTYPYPNSPRRSGRTSARTAETDDLEIRTQVSSVFTLREDGIGSLRDKQRDDERYPIPVYSNPDDYPELVPPGHKYLELSQQQQLQQLYYLQQQRKLQNELPYGPGLHAHSPSPPYPAKPDGLHTLLGRQHPHPYPAYFDESKRGPSPYAGAYNPTPTPRTGADSSRGGSGGRGNGRGNAREPARGRGTICGIPKPTFWVLVVLGILIVAGAVVAGVVGSGVLNKSNNTSGSTSSSGSGTTPTTTASSSTATSTAVSIKASDRALAVSSTAGTGSNQTTAQIFYQALNSVNIQYRLIWADTAQSEQVLALKVAPNAGTPLAVTASNTSATSAVTVSLFYLTTTTSTPSTGSGSSSSKTTQVARAVLSCTPGSSTCDVTSNAVISGSVGKNIAAGTGLAALLVNGNATQPRVYFQATGQVVWELSTNDPDSGSWTSATMSVSGAVNGSIAATVEGAPGELMVIYTASSNIPTVLEYSDTAGGGTGTLVSSSAPSGFTNSSSMAACYVAGLDQYQLYYVTSAGVINAYSRAGTSGTWTFNHDAHWASSDGNVAAVGWQNNVRLLYFSGGKLAMNTQRGTTWSAATNP